jgi:hypothetical protein
VEGLRIISGGGRPMGACRLLDWKTEVWLAASPADPRRLTAAWIQGVRSADTGPYSGGDSSTNMWATSTDGGASWTNPQPVPGLTKCTGGSQPPAIPGKADWAADPFVSFGADGIAYLSSVHIGPLVPLVCCGYVNTNRSPDAGLHFDAPVVVDQPGVGRNDLAAVTADPRIPGRAYLAWRHFSATFSLRFSTTTNGGGTWSRGTVVEQAIPGHVFDPAPVKVMPDSSLLLFYADFLLPPGAFAPGVTPAVMGPQNAGRVWVVRSTDGGRSWSAPAKVVDDTFPAVDSGSFADAPDGSVYMAWRDHREGKVMIVRSADLGHSWSQPRQVASQPGAQEPTMAVDRDGTIGITWYDNRRPGPGPNTDVWFADSHDLGATWSETHLAGPFDLTPCCGADNPPLGAYEGLVATPDGFAAAFIMAKPKAKAGPSDVFFARILVRG